MSFCVSGLVAISQWKCTNLIYLTVPLPFLSVFLCYAAHSSDLGMVIIGLRSLSCSANVVECMYTNTSTPPRMNLGAKTHFGMISVSSARKKHWWFVRNIKEYGSVPYRVPHGQQKGLNMLSTKSNHYYFIIICSILAKWNYNLKHI